MDRQYSFRRFPPHRKRYVSVTDLEGDTVLDAMARLEARRILQHHANSVVKNAVQNRSEPASPTLVKKHLSHLRFSKAPLTHKPIQSPILATSTRVSPSTRDAFPPKPQPNRRKTSLHKWVSPFTLRGVAVLPKGSNSPTSLQVSPPKTPEGLYKKRLWTGEERWWEGDLPLGALLRKKVMKTLTGRELG